MFSQKTIFWGFGTLQEKTHDSTTFIVCKINVFQTAQCLSSVVIAAGEVLTENSLLSFPVSRLQIPFPFVVGTTNTSSNEKD